MMEIQSKVDFYSELMSDVESHCAKLDKDLPNDLTKVLPAVHSAILGIKII